MTVLTEKANMDSEKEQDETETKNVSMDIETTLTEEKMSELLKGSPDETPSNNSLYPRIETEIMQSKLIEIPLKHNTNSSVENMKRKADMYTCRFCNQTFQDTSDMDTHIIQFHLTDLEYEESTYQPTQSAEKFKSKKATAVVANTRYSPPPPYVNFMWDTAPSIVDPKIGYWTGIQGQNNSCYLDSALFGLFAFSNYFDMFLQRQHDTSPSDTHIINHLRTAIVNELRLRGYVDSSSMILFRRMIASKFPGNDFNGACYEKSLEEAIDFLFGLLQIPKVSYNHGSHTNMDTYSFQLFPLSLTLQENISIQQLLEGNWQKDAQFVRKPEYLFFIVPRYSKKEKLFTGILPELEITIRVGDKPEKYELVSAWCIQLSHYVVFSRNIKGEFYFFDSMADREDESNIPIVRLVPNIEKMLHKGVKKVSTFEKDADAMRLLQDVSFCMYIPSRYPEEQKKK